MKNYIIIFLIIILIIYIFTLDNKKYSDQNNNYEHLGPIIPPSEPTAFKTQNIIKVIIDAFIEDSELTRKKFNDKIRVLISPLYENPKININMNDVFDELKIYKPTSYNISSMNHIITSIIINVFKYNGTEMSYTLFYNLLNTSAYFSLSILPKKLTSEDTYREIKTEYTIAAVDKTDSHEKIFNIINMYNI